MHLLQSTDEKKWGYFEYPSHYFLLDGKIVSTLVCYLAGILKIPYNAYIICMDVIGIILMFLSCFILYKTLLQLTKYEKTLNKKWNKRNTNNWNNIVISNDNKYDYNKTRNGKNRRG